MGSNPLGTNPTSSSSKPPKRTRLLYGSRVSLFSFLVAVPALLASGILIWIQPWHLESRISLITIELFVWWLLAVALREEAIRPLQTLANVVASLREGDYSFRARSAAPEDALGELSLEVNLLADMLAEQKVRAIEATALLRRVVDEIDAPLFAFDRNGTLQLVNPAGERLVQQPAVRLLGRTAEELNLQECLSAANESLVELNLKDSQARWLLRRSSFRQNGVPHTLVVLSDVSRALRDEERRAWQRLIRVLGHELSNSLAPIKSIAGSLSTRLSETGMDTDVRSDLQRGLEIIGARSASLHRFLQAYRQLAQMPPPTLSEVALGPLVARVAGLETRLRVQVQPGPTLTCVVDPDQLEQMLINLVRNAVDAVLEPSTTPAAAKSSSAGQPAAIAPEVTMRWTATERDIVLSIEDNGPGLLNPSNVFTPFYTTKPTGTGVGLVLSRQIVEAHGGRIDLSNRTNGCGCVARVVIPRGPLQSAAVG